MASNAADYDLIKNVESFRGGRGVDTFTGDSLNNSYFATIDDVRDVFDGGTGTDTADYSAYLTANLSVTLTGATAAVVSGSGSDAATSDTIANVENFVGGGGHDVIVGNGLANTLTGGLGADTISGNAGNDIFIATVDDYRDTFDGGDGVDTANYSANYGAYGNTRDLSVTLDGSNSVTVLGSGTSTASSDQIVNVQNFGGGAGQDSITGDSNNNSLNGAGGDDLINGKAGSDTLN